MRKLYEKAATPHEWFPALVEHAREVGIPWFSSVFGLQSLALLESLDCPAYKIAAIDSQNEGLCRWVAASGRPWIQSVRPGVSKATGQWSDDEFGEIVFHGTEPLALLCPEGYPQPNAQLGALSWTHTGYSYHGTSSEIPALAALCGAKLVECHFHLENEPSELEANVSLNESQFTGMVGRIRHLEGLLGDVVQPTPQVVVATLTEWADPLAATP